MRLDGLQVIVVGGATGGCGTALLLARAGAQVTLFERTPAATPVGAGIAIAANGFAVLESLGLGPALAAARRSRAARVVDGRGRTLLVPPAGADVRLLRRSTLQRVLLDAVAAEPRITAHFGCEVTAVAADGTVHWTDGGTRHALRSDLVVAADGVHSRVRASLDFGAHVTMPGIDYLRALVDAPALEEEAWTAAGIFGSFAVDGGTYLFASAGTSATRAAVAAGDLATLRRIWAEAYPPSTPLLAAIAGWEQVLVNRVTHVHCARWSVGRVTLLGDAAHAMSPNLGQGANSALVDAAVLLDELRRSTDVASALAAYERRRRPAVTRVARMAHRLGVISEETRAPRRWVRDRVLLPLARRLTRDPSALLLQEDPAVLYGIGRR